MSLDYIFPSSSHLPPTTPPPSYQYDYDPVSIVDSSGSGTVSEQETILASPSDTLIHRPLAFKIHHLRYDSHRQPSPAPAVSRLRKRQPTTASSLTPPPLSPCTSRPTKRAKMDMRLYMAQPGSVAAAPGFQTPLATYVAQMVVWLWYGDIRPPTSTHLPHNSPLLDVPDNYDIAQHPTSPLNPLQVQPAPEFSNFVARMLQITMVSHSVTLIALLYIYRLKMRHRFDPKAGSEQRPFLAGLMLSNKYLDDNTYTNSTWSELSGVPLVEVNQMEREFIGGLSYDLGVPISEYQHWTSLLDGFMLARQQGLAPSRHARQSSTGRPHPHTTQPAPLVFPSINDNNTYRARSASPPRIVTYNPTPSVYPPVADHVRKHSAVDMYTDPAAFYQSLQLHLPSPTNYIAPTQHLQHNLAMVQARPALTREPSGSSLGRSTSLNRQYGRIEPTNTIYERRGSAGHTYATINDVPTSVQPRQEYTAAPMEWDGGHALLAPYERPDQQPQYIPPEHLMFYKLTAAPHPGPDGAPRKGRLRFQDPSQPSTFRPAQNVPSYPTQTYMPINTQPTPHVYNYEYDRGEQASPSGVYQTPYGGGEGNVYVDLTPNPTGPSISNMWASSSPTYVDPQPAQFANAGPPGYSYNPYIQNQHQTWQYPTAAGPAINLNVDVDVNPEQIGQYDQFAPSNRWSTISDDQLYSYGIPTNGNGDGEGWHHLQPQGQTLIQSRSEWSSPVIQRYN